MNQKPVTVESLESRQMFDATHLSIINQPQDATAGNSLGTVRVLVLDDSNHIVSGDSSSITLAITDGTGADGATLGGTATVAASHGMATFTGINITKAGAGYTLTASDGDLTSDDSDSFDVSAGAQTGLVYHAAPQDSVAGEAGDDAVVVYAVDKYNNVVTDDNQTVTIAVSSGSDTLNGTVAVTAQDGVATFDDLSIDTAGAYKLTASQGKMTVASDSLNITAADADHLAFKVVPTATVAGVAMGAIKVQVLDAYGNLVTDDTSDVTLSIDSGPTGAELGGTEKQTADGGVATFDDITLNKAGAYTLDAADGELDGDTSGTTTITPAAAAALDFKTAPVKSVAGNTIALAVQIEDAFGNVVTTDKSKVTLALDADNSPAGAKITGATTATAAGGVATFGGISLTSAGSYKFNFTDGSLTGLASSAFTITPGAAAKIVFGTAPSTVVAGAAMTAVTVKVQDKFGNTVTGDKSKASIAIATGPAGATIGNAMIVRAASGSTSFSKLILNKAGSYTFKVTDGKLPAITSGAIAVTPAAAYKLVLSTGPAAAAKIVAGTKLTPITAQVQDRYGNLVTTDSSSISASIVGGGTLGGTTSVAAVKGIATFSTLAINAAADSYSLKFADGSLKTARSNPFSVTPGAAAKLYLPTSPDDMTAGDTIAPLGVFIFDAFNNQVTTDASKVTVAITGPTGSKLTGTTTITATNGFAGFTDLGATLAGTGNKLTFTDGKLTAAVSNTFAVAADDAKKVVITTQPVGTTAGKTLANVVAKIEDQYGNVVTGDTSDVTIATATTPTDADDLDGTDTQTAVAGVATFNDLKLTTAGNYTLKVTDGDLDSNTSSTFAITPGAAAALQVTKSPTSAAAGATLGAMTVQVLDAYDNLITTDASKITATIAADTGTKGAALTGTATVAAAKGIATFSGLSITTAGSSYRIKFTDGTLTADLTEEFNITAGAAAKLVFGQAPSAATTGTAIDPAITVAIEDKFGNVVTDNTSNVTIAVATGATGATLGGTKTQAADDGIATFDDLTLDKAGTYTLKATDGSLTAIISPSFKIAAAA